MGSIFFELTVVICLAATLTIFFRILKQPLILAYILTGIILGPLGVLRLGNGEFMSAMGELGITLLLFILGLELQFSELRSVGKVASIGSLVQVVLTFFLGFLFSQLLGFAFVPSLYLAIAVSFSSTIIVVKILSDKKDLHSLYGKISVGMLLIQDFFAILTLIILSAFQNSSGEPLSLMTFSVIFLKGIVLFAIIGLLSRTVFPKIIDYVAKSQEALFLGSLAFALGMAAIVSSKFIGFSVEIGGLVAGLALANASASMQIVARVRALRDFFITIFFVFLGTQMVFTNIFSLLPAVIVLTAVVLLYKPLIVLVTLSMMGYRKRTSFFTSLSLGQVSEFSLIVVFLGAGIGQISDEIVSLVTFIAVISYVVSNYVMMHENTLYRKYHEYFDMFEGGNTTDTIGNTTVLRNHVVLIGAHRIGANILDAIENQGTDVVVVDFNPEVMEQLKKRPAIQSMFGDISDIEIQEKLQLENAKLIISTVPDMEDNLFLLSGLKNSKAMVVVLAQSSDEAKTLYKAGADYVLLPHILGGRHIVKILKENDRESLKQLREKDEKYLY